MRVYNIALKTGPKRVKPFGKIGPRPQGPLGMAFQDGFGDSAVDMTATPDGNHLLVLTGNGDVYMMSSDFLHSKGCRVHCRCTRPLTTTMARNRARSPHLAPSIPQLWSRRRIRSLRGRIRGFGHFHTVTLAIMEHLKDYAMADDNGFCHIDDLRQVQFGAAPGVYQRSCRPPSSWRGPLSSASTPQLSSHLIWKRAYTRKFS
ncbi:unnamed protein product [Leptidea sinapis]|nr:unnamed protein product [Leptidea sinapis]